MHRCLQLAALGRGSVAPNPMVGAVLVYEDRVIGEGYHQVWGEAHAEVACVQSVAEKDRSLIAGSTLYVSLEPCAHVGKTPPCADLIVANNIPRVVIGCSDPFPQVNGKGIGKLRVAGIAVLTGVLDNECRELNRRFFTFHTVQRPYIILKWAQTANGKISGADGTRLKISNERTDRLVHKWRSEEAGILVGTNTALLDNPALTTRLSPGRNPTRIVVDKGLKLPQTLRLFDKRFPTIVFNTVKSEHNENLDFVQIGDGDTFLPQLLTWLHKRGIQSVIIEGGAALLQSFINQNLWDEARVITSNAMHTDTGIDAPKLSKAQLISSEIVGSDLIHFYKS